jgi:glycine dehydrogenase subunit 1
MPHSNGDHFNEFAIQLPGSTQDCLEYLDAVGIVGGFNLASWYPTRTNWLLVTFTDQTQVQDIDLLVKHLSGWISTLEVAA